MDPIYQTIFEKASKAEAQYLQAEISFAPRKSAKKKVNRIGYGQVGQMINECAVPDNGSRSKARAVAARKTLRRQVVATLKEVKEQAKQGIISDEIEKKFLEIADLSSDLTFPPKSGHMS
jgi:hypothetical protein